MNIPTFSLKAEQTCIGSTELCRKYCYAKKAERYPSAWFGRMRNTMDTLKADFVDKTVKIIKRKNPQYLRIHESGDFYSQEYLDKWFQICKKLPKTTFLCYTQSYGLNWDKKPKNLIRFWSIWADSKDIPEEGLKAFAIDNGKGKLPPTLLPEAIHLCGKGKTLKCENCLYCYKGTGNVAFKVH